MQAICQIALEALYNNYRYFQECVDSAQVIPVVKANAYGHGAIEVTRHLYRTMGVRLFAVATLEEACELAKALPHISILIFSRIFTHELSQLPDNTILSIGSMQDANELVDSGYAGIKVHLNVNTGMNRLGLTPDQAIELITNSKISLNIDGVYSHFSSSDTENTVIYNTQNEIFKNFVLRIKQHGFSGLVHLANSAGTLKRDQEYYDAVRIGIGLYGYDTSPDGHAQKHLIPVMEVLAPLIRVEQVKAGQSVSYAEKWQSAVDTNIGTLRIGYADGYNRLLTNRGLVSFRGKTYPVVGTVTMDHIMIDLGADSPPSGSMFTVMGGASPDILIKSIAEKLNTITYEVCCNISPRVTRRYTE